MDLAGGGTGTPVARGGAWGRQPRSETNARRDASRTRDSKRSYRSEPAVSGWTTEVASGPTSVGRHAPRARADVRACAKSTSCRFRKRGTMGRRRDARGRAVNETRGPRVDVGRDGRRTTTVLGSSAARGGARGDTRRSSGVGDAPAPRAGSPLTLGRHHARTCATRRTRRQPQNDFFAPTFGRRRVELLLGYSDFLRRTWRSVGIVYRTAQVRDVRVRGPIRRTDNPLSRRGKHARVSVCL